MTTWLTGVVLVLLFTFIDNRIGLFKWKNRKLSSNTPLKKAIGYSLLSWLVIIYVLFIYFFTEGIEFNVSSERYEKWNSWFTKNDELI